ncbi:hypothetical protein ACHQM5_006682 [Ranunculus cassubicifolius]
MVDHQLYWCYRTFELFLYTDDSPKRLAVWLMPSGVQSSPAITEISHQHVFFSTKPDEQKGMMVVWKLSNYRKSRPHGANNMTPSNGDKIRGNICGYYRCGK